MPESYPRARPSTTLRQEHEVILRILGVLERLLVRFEESGSFEADSLLRCVDFFRHFADACHHAKEESLLFPVLESRGIPREGGPIGVMLYEHSVARELTRRMGEALEGHRAGAAHATDQFCDSARQYLQLLRQHIFKEDNVLFTMGDRLMSASDQSTLCARFGEVGCRAFGGETREQLEEMANELERCWPAPRTRI